MFFFKGIIKTKFSEALWATPEAQAQATQGIPAGRLGEIDDIAPLAVFLASADSTYVTGENFVAAGGMTSRL